MVRTDESIGDEFVHAKSWLEPLKLRGGLDIWEERPDGKPVLHSWSGHERNHLFLNLKGKQFRDISLVSGLDSIADSRALVLWDFDHDGWQDIAVVNANRPQLQLFQNRIGSLQKSLGTAQKMVAVRLVGGNRTDNPASEWACRDGYGAMVTVMAGQMKLKREHRCGEGYGAQNSATMIVGMGSNDVAQSVAVRWPSGKVQEVGDVRAGSLVTFFENPEHSPTDISYTIADYRASSPAQRAITTTTTPSTMRLGPTRPFRFEQVAPQQASESQSRLILYTTMATWCQACRSHLPQLAHLRRTMGSDTLDIVALPIDAGDTQQKLDRYVDEVAAPYRMVSDLTAEERREIKTYLAKTLNTGALPATIVTDEFGNVLLTISAYRQSRNCDELPGCAERLLDV